MTQREDLYEEGGLTAARHTDVNCETHINLPAEAVYVTEGVLGMTIEDEPCRIEKGQIAFVLPFEKHSFCTPLSSRCLVIMFPLSLCREFLRATEGKIPGRRVITPDECLMSWVLASLPGEECTPDALTGSALAGALLSQFVKHGGFHPGENRYDTLFLEALRSIDRDVTRKITLPALARELGVHPVTLSRKFSASAGIGLSEYVSIRRSHCAAKLLREEGDLTVAQIAYRSGFGSIRQFNRAFRDGFGCTPKEYRRGK